MKSAFGFVEFMSGGCRSIAGGGSLDFGFLNVDGNCASLLQEVGSWSCVDFVEV